MDATAPVLFDDNRYSGNVTVEEFTTMGLSTASDHWRDA